jgi:hypothetical protein
VLSCARLSAGAANCFLQGIVATLLGSSKLEHPASLPQIAAPATDFVERFSSALIRGHLSGAAISS